MAMESLNPATGELIKRFEEPSSQEIESLLAGAAARFESWRTTPMEERTRLMAGAAKALRDGKDRYAEIMTVEMGKPITQSAAEVEKCAWVCDYYAEEGPRHLSPRFVETDADESFVRYDPIGPVLAVMPWNFPFWQVFRFAAPALVAGNVGLLKHASNVPQCALAIEEVFCEAGFPEGAFTTLLIGAKTAEGVIRDPRIKAATLTGSDPAGRKVASTAGRELKKTVLELGGSDPFVVLEDADLDKAADVAALARCINSGQSCIAAKRFIVVQDVLEAFEAKFRAALEKVVVGDPMDPKTEVGPMARADLRDELHDQVTRSVDAGARCLLGGAVPDGPGCFYPVTLLSGVREGMAAADEETFGPVAPVIAVPDAEEAVALANRSEFGLGASVWTNDLDRGKALAARIESGAVFVNGLVKSDPRLPFGGVKLSGYGRELSEEGIREFVNIKTVWAAAT